MRLQYAGGFVSIQYGINPCIGILDDVLPDDYRFTRTSSRQTLRSIVLNGVFQGGIGYVVGRGSGTFVQLATWVADNMYRSVAVSVLGTMWNGAGCGNRQVRATRVYYATIDDDFSLNATINCEWEEWQISFDGGSTWYPFEVRVCEVRFGAT